MRVAHAWFGLVVASVSALTLYLWLGSAQDRLPYLFQCYVVGRGGDIGYPEGYSGIWKTWYPNGRLKLRVEVRDGVNWGVYQEYYPSGCLRLDWRFVQGLSDGKTREFYDADRGGGLMAEFVYYQELLISESRYAPDGFLVDTIIHDELEKIPDDDE